MKHGKFVVGFVVGGLLLGSIGVYADSALKQITAYQNSDIKVTVNGSAVDLSSAEGTMYPIVYDGHSYVSAKAVAEALGASVKWNSDTQTVEITGNSGVPSSSVGIPDKDNSDNVSTDGIALSSLEYARTDGKESLRMNAWKDRAFQIAGKTYSNGIGMNLGFAREKYVVYNLNSKYNTLSGSFAIDDLNKDLGDSSGTLIIIGDDKEIFRKEKVKAGNITPISVNVSGVNQIKIVFDCETYRMFPVFVNAKLK